MSEQDRKNIKRINREMKRETVRQEKRGRTLSDDTVKRFIHKR